MSILRTTLSGFLLVLLVLSNGCHDESSPGPTIISLSPNEAPVGKLVTITGTNFSSVSSFDNTVEFNGISAVVSTGTNTTIVVTVPKGATTGRVAVTVKGKGKTQSPTDFIVNDCSTCGFVGKFSLSNNYNYTIEPINATKMYYEKSATKRGINFRVKKKMRIKAIGGLFRKTGSYPMELTSWSSGTLYTTTINANDTENFVFENVAGDIQLIPDIQYTLRYCGENHDSVYDLYPLNSSSGVLQPFDFGDVILIDLFYSYINNCSQPGYLAGWGSGYIHAGNS